MGMPSKDDLNSFVNELKDSGIHEEAMALARDTIDVMTETDNPEEVMRLFKEGEYDKAIEMLDIEKEEFEERLDRIMNKSVELGKEIDFDFSKNE